MKRISSEEVGIELRPSGGHSCRTTRLNSIEIGDWHVYSHGDDHRQEVAR